MCNGEGRLGSQVANLLEQSPLPITARIRVAPMLHGIAGKRLNTPEITGKPCNRKQQGKLALVMRFV